MRKITAITSAANPLIKDIRKAIARGGLTSDGLCIAEGFHLLDEALRSGCEVPVVVAAESASAVLECPVTVVPDQLFETIAGTETTQGVIALVRPREWSFEDLFRGRSLVIVLDAIQDPGNAGTIVRAAEAFGATGVLFLKGCVNPHNPKTLRASAGSLFRVPYLAGVEGAIVWPVPLYAAMPFTGAERLASDANLAGPCAIAIGSEGRGLGAELRRVAEPVAIPTEGVESLNAAVAASVLLYEARRQRSFGKS
jgi:TrmH family RNA methyltransferase